MPVKSTAAKSSGPKRSRKQISESSRRSAAITAGSAGTYEPDAGRPVRVIGQEVIDLVRQLDGPIMGPIGERLANSLQSGVSTTQLAEEIGTTQATLHRIMTNTVTPKETVLRLLCKYYGLELRPVPRGKQ